MQILYRNWKDEVSIRNISVIDIVYESNEFHPEPTWLLHAFDNDKQAERTFVVDRILKQEFKTSYIDAMVHFIDKPYLFKIIGEHYYLLDVDGEIFDGQWCFEIYDEYETDKVKFNVSPEYSFYLRQLNMDYLRESPEEFCFHRIFDGSCLKVIASSNPELNLKYEKQLS
jgi:hypothetical protein